RPRSRTSGAPSRSPEPVLLQFDVEVDPRLRHLAPEAGRVRVPELAGQREPALVCGLDRGRVVSLLLSAALRARVPWLQDRVGTGRFRAEDADLDVPAFHARDRVSAIRLDYARLRRAVLIHDDDRPGRHRPPLVFDRSTERGGATTTPGQRRHQDNRREPVYATHGTGSFFRPWERGELIGDTDRLAAGAGAERP